jgi:hypothetical protein
LCQEIFTRTLLSQRGLVLTGAVMKRTALALILISALLPLTLVGVQSVKVANANFTPPEINVVIQIDSPQNAMYSERDIPLNVVLSGCDATMKNYHVTYELNNQRFSLGEYHEDGTPHVYNSTLNLRDGQYAIVVSVSIGNFYASQIVYFTVCTTNPPMLVSPSPSPQVKVQPQILSPQNKTYNANNLPLNFTVNQPASSIFYSLDRHDKMTVNGNTTLIGVPEGAHTLTVYAQNTAGNWEASETIYFSIAKPVPFPTTLVIAHIVLMAIISVGLLVYIKKPKR